MKNNHVSHAPWMMRVSLMLLFMAFSVQWSFAQLDLNVSRTTLGKVIEQIKSQSSYNFFYDDKLASLSVENVKLSNASIEKVLDAVLKGKNIAFKIEGDVIYLSEKSQTPQNGSQQGKERTIIGTDNLSESLAVKGPIASNGLPNFFSVSQLDKQTTRREEVGYREQTQSVFTSAEVGYKNAYYLTLTGRNDWPSQLAGPNSKQSSFFYPSVGTSILLSEIFNLPESISYLKLRASWASVGLPFGRFLANPTFEWDFSTGAYKSQAAYPLYELKPERTESWEVGLTARFLKYFNFDVSFYNTKTYNQTVDAQLSPTGGYNKFYAQTGEVRNRGVELSLEFKNTWNKFTWNSNYTFSANKNKILSLIDGYVNPVTGETISKERLEVGGLANAKFLLKVGGSLGDLYSVKDLVRDSNNNIYVDEEGKVAINEKAGDIFLGSVFPKANMAWRNDFQYGNWGLGFLLTARLGGVVYSATQAVLDSYGVSEASAAARDNGGVWVNGTDQVDAQNWYTVVGADSGIPQYYTYSATNLRLQEASISYTIPRAKLKNVMDITLSLVGRNLWMIYSKAPFDPEAVASTGNYYQGIDYFMMPSLRSVGFNLKLKF